MDPIREWSNSRSLQFFREANCGIVGGNRLDFIQYYASLAIDMMLNEEYAAAWRSLRDLSGYNILVEQFLLDACFEYHRFHPQSPFRGIHMRLPRTRPTIRRLRRGLVTPTFSVTRSAILI